MFCGPSFIVITMQAWTTPIFNVFGYDWARQLLIAPERCLLRSAGATEGLFVPRELHHEPLPRTHTKAFTVEQKKKKRVRFTDADTSDSDDTTRSSTNKISHNTGNKKPGSRSIQTVNSHHHQTDQRLWPIKA